MVLARVANFLTSGDESQNLAQTDGRNATASMQKLEAAVDTVGRAVEEEIDDDAARPPYLHVSNPRQHNHAQSLTTKRPCWPAELEAPRAIC